MFIIKPLLFFCSQLEYVMKETFLLSLWVQKLIFLLQVSTYLICIFPRDRLWVLKNVGLLDMCLFVHNRWMSHCQQSAVAPCSLLVSYSVCYYGQILQMWKCDRKCACPVNLPLIKEIIMRHLVFTMKAFCAEYLWCISEKLWSFVHIILQNLFPTCVWALSFRLQLSGVGTTVVPWCWIGGSAPCSLW